MEENEPERDAKLKRRDPIGSWHALPAAPQLSLLSFPPINRDEGGEQSTRDTERDGRKRSAETGITEKPTTRLC